MAGDKRDHEFAERMLHVARETASMLLERTGRVSPIGISFDTHGREPDIFFPSDDDRSAPKQEATDVVLDEMRARAADERVGGVVLIAGLESGNDNAVAIQLETAQGTALLLIYPYTKRLLGWRLGEPETSSDLLFDRVYSQHEP